MADPVYPSFDNRLLATASNGPEQMQRWGNVSQQQLALGMQQLQASSQVFGSIAALPNPTQQDVIRATTALRQLGIPADRIANGLAEVSALGNDSAKIKQWAYGHVTRNMSVAQQMEAAFGTPTLVNDGQRQNPVRVQTGPNAGVYPAGGQPVTNRLTPGEASTPIQGPPDAQGAPTVIPKARFSEEQGISPRGTYGNASSAPGMRTQLPPGAAEAQQRTAEAGAQQGIELQKSADGIPTRKGMLAQLETDLDHFTSGPGADWQNVAKAWANRNVLPSGFQFDPKSIASQEAFAKQATQLAQQQFGALGGTGTDAKLDSAFKSNPNTALSDMGNRGIIQLLKGNEDAINAKNLAWQKWKATHGSDSYDRFTTEFNKRYNPLVFQAQYMNPEEIKKLRSKLSEPDRKRFEEGYRIAKGAGWLGGGSDARP